MSDENHDINAASAIDEHNYPKERKAMITAGPPTENNFDAALARCVHQRPNTNEEELRKDFCVSRSVIRRHLPSGIPRQWTKEIVKKLLDEWILQFGDKLMPCLLAKKARYLHRALYKFELYKEYPLHYWRFNPLIYPLFGMEAPKDYGEELQMEWPPQKTLHTRYRELLKIHHPDRYHRDYQASRVAHFKFRWVVKAYNHLLRRHKKLTIGEPPPATRQMSIQVANNGKKIVS